MLKAFRRWSTGSWWLGALFLMVLVPSAVTLVWLGAQLVDQDRRSWAELDLARRESAADIITRALGQQLAAADAERSKAISWVAPCSRASTEPP